jgi:hypothetical protein
MDPGARIRCEEIHREAPIGIAMMAGFVTCYPATGWLIKAGVKEKI